MKKIARVFPRKTNMTPQDEHVYFEPPDLFTPEYDEVLISVAFTWDIQRGKWLKSCWESVCNNVHIGGPAFGDPGNGFKPGRFLKNGVVITSRGCPNNCDWCFVPKREGKIRELPIRAGNIIQDNNLLACSSSHIDGVFKMLTKQRRIDFAGGLEAARINSKLIERLRGLSIYQIWTAYDHPAQERQILRAIERLRSVFRLNQVRCFVLIGMEGDTLEKAEARLQTVFEAGALPFAMRYRTPSSDWKGSFIYTERPWNLLTRKWTRPAAMKARHPMNRPICLKGVIK